jgi:hypothetical protein
MVTLVGNFREHMLGGERASVGLVRDAEETQEAYPFAPVLAERAANLDECPPARLTCKVPVEVGRAGASFSPIDGR